MSAIVGVASPLAESGLNAKGSSEVLMELLSEFRPGYGQSVKYYRRAESAWVYWEHWEWRTSEPPPRRVLLAWWFTPIGVIVGLVTVLIALVGSTGRAEPPRWVHVESGWCDPYTFEQIRAMSS